MLPLLRDPARWIALPPFLDAAAYPARDPRRADAPRLIVVAMMRHGDKLESYRLLAAALAQLLDVPWSLDIVGDGSARAEVEAALAPLGARVTYHGAFDAAGVAAALAGADLFVWPAINEAFGMALLEAQASGLPVVAGASGGVGDIVVPGTTGLLEQLPAVRAAVEQNGAALRGRLCRGGAAADPRPGRARRDGAGGSAKGAA